MVLCLLALRQRDRIAAHALLLTAYGLHGLGGVPIAILMTGLVPLRIDATSLWQLEAIAFTSLLASAVFVGMVARYRQAQLAKDRAVKVRDSLVAAGVAPNRVLLDKPLQAEANLSGEDPAARRVEVTVK